MPILCGRKNVFFGNVEFMVRKKFIFQKQTFVSGACTYIQIPNIKSKITKSREVFLVSGTNFVMLSNEATTI